jgi:hypothetical protein
MNKVLYWNVFHSTFPTKGQYNVAFLNAFSNFCTGQKILQKLTEECELVDELNNCCLTVHSYLLPQSSKLYKELAKKEKGNNTKEKKGKNTKEKKGKNTKTSGNTMEATMNKLSGNNMPNQNSGNGPAGSMDSSAPVRSISDTASSSLDMSRPSGSGWSSNNYLIHLPIHTLLLTSVEFFVLYQVKLQEFLGNRI